MIADDLVMDVAIKNSLRVWVSESTRTKNFQPAKADVLGSVYIGVRRMTASLAFKLVTSLAIGFLGVSALAAPLTGVSWINSDQFHASQLRLVVEECPQLCEAPSMQRRPFALSGLYPSSNASEFFNGDCAAGAFSETDDLFGNYMVGVGGKARLFTAAFLQKPLGRFCSFGLQLSPDGLVSMADLVQLVPAEFISVTIGGDYGDAKINTKNIGRLQFHRVRQYDANIKKEFSVSPENQIGLLNQTFSKNLALIISASELNALAISDCPNGNLLFCYKDFQISDVKSDAAMRPENPLRFLVNLVGIGNLAKNEARCLRPQAELCPHIFVITGLQSELRKDSMCEAFGGNPISRPIASRQRFTQDSGLRGVWQKFQLDGDNHLFSIIEQS